MRRLTVIFLFLSFLASLAIAEQVPAEDVQKIEPWIIEVPQDFSVTAIAGGIAPGTTVDKVEINSKGEAVHWSLIQGGTRAGQYKKVRTFSIGKSFLSYLYRSILNNKFFDLGQEYVALDVLDGTFAVLSVTADGRTYTVSTRNKPVAAFDKIMSALNSILPEENKVLYNEILQ